MRETVMDDVMAGRLTIAIDFDDTFTSDPCLWSNFVVRARDSGHRVICVTARRESPDSVELINEMFDEWACQMPIYFTALGSKLDHMKRLGVPVHIWIDDSPETLVHGW